ncbi:hypothetical protein, partial [uncultured Thermanaerothrix sp.]|uniref:hypothetical protein n=1 Tax=uncultured Thermanaerothrix sp. TaxID=1195149 RepID=UPI0026045573
TITNHSGHIGTPFGPSPDSDSFKLPSPTVVNASIHVDDTNGGSWQFDDSGSTSYTKTFTCDADKGKYGNTATIRETGQSASAEVQINCYALEVTKTASPSFTRTYNWTIDKWADVSELTLSTGQTYSPVNYSVKVAVSGYTDSAWAVSGTISVYNPAPMAAEINEVSDMVSPDISATVDCGVTFPYTLDTGSKLTCTYSANLPDDSGRTNTATALLQNYTYDKDGKAEKGGTTAFSGTAEVNFASATMTEKDTCVEVYDGATYLGQVCNTASYTFTYDRAIGPYNTCGEYQVLNTAYFVTNDLGISGQDSWTIYVMVPCGGCTLTQGYWKTHSSYGPAPYDDTWAMIGENTKFFLINQTYYQVMWTSPIGGNAYYILAHQYIAARLNIYNGAWAPSSVNDAIAWAESFFNTYKPADKLSKTVRAEAIYYAGILAKYNEGYIGPGHCSE